MCHSHCKSLTAKNVNEITIKNESCKPYLGNKEQKLLFLNQTRSGAQIELRVEVNLSSPETASAENCREVV